MKVLVLGGTRFIGRAIVEELHNAGHDVTILHRGQWEPADLPPVKHIHGSREAIDEVIADLRSFDPEALVDTRALGRPDTEPVLKALEWIDRKVVLSSCDVYQAYDALRNGASTELVPINERSRVREKRYPYRGQMPGMDDYEKLDVEEEYLKRGGTVLRLGFVFGPRDYQRREEMILRRIRGGRKEIPFGSGNWISSRCFVKDAGSAGRLSVESDEARGRIFNVVESQSMTVMQWAEAIIEAAGAELEIVRVDERALPEDLGLTGSVPQHMLFDSHDAEQLLGWKDTRPVEALRQSVEWHLANPPEEWNQDFSADDDALGQRLS